MGVRRGGCATGTLDGTDIRLTIHWGKTVWVEKRRNPTKAQKADGILDGWFVDADSEAAADRWIYEAVNNTDVSGWPDGEHPSEALGPKIQGNELGLETHLCVPFNLEIPTYQVQDRSFDSLKSFLADLESRFAPGHLSEGIVFHHADGRRAKIKRKDFAYA